jgi:exodeoxyribonuclease V alpha subunit
MNRVRRLVPSGSAREEWLRAWRPLDAEASRSPVAEPSPAPTPTDEFEPAYFGWEVARCAPGLEGPEPRVLAALAAACVASIRSGSTRLPLQDEPLSAALASWGAPGGLEVALGLLARARRGAANDPVVSALGLPGDRKPLIVDGDWLYAERMHALEERFCARIRERAAGSRALEGRAVGRAVAAVAAGARPLTDEQQRAVRAALGAPLALVTGGPGTGKTATAVALLRAIAWMGVPMEQLAVAAPTGKAAQRLADAIAIGLAQGRDLADAGLRAIAPAPQTIHRLLGWSPSRGRFARHENDPLPYRYVVVDEASMIDLAMMDRLVRALRRDATLVLLGDADQLPSIEAGAVFRDLCAGLGAARLTVNLRVANDPSARRITDAARAVNAGTIDARFAEAVTPRHAVDEVAFEGVEHLAARWSDAGDALLDRWWRVRVAADEGFARRSTRTYRYHGGEFAEDDRAALRALFEDHARSRLLCVTRVRGFPSSADAINDRLLARLRAETLQGRAGGRASGLCPGTPVVVQRNDYERGLYNGDQGVVVRVDVQASRSIDAKASRPTDAQASRPTDAQASRSVDAEAPDDAPPMVVFPRASSFEVFPLDAAGDLAPAFAMTVHKAQGSEFDHVAVVLPDEDLPLLTRELLYTAMTRARRSVLLVGDPDLLARAVSRTVERFSGVAARLKKRR